MSTLFLRGLGLVGLALALLYLKRMKQRIALKNIFSLIAAVSFITFGGCSSGSALSPSTTSGSPSGTSTGTTGSTSTTDSDTNTDTDTDTDTNTPPNTILGKIGLDLQSEWTTDFCSTNEIFASSANGGYGNWSSKIVTSEWNGSPWSCLSARVYSSVPGLQINLKLKSEWLDVAYTTESSTPYAWGPGWSSYSNPIITSEWNGSPWSALSASMQVNYDPAHPFGCRVSFQALSGSCTTNPVSTGLTDVISKSNASTAWTPWFITGEWDGSPWPCLRARLECIPL